MSEPPGQESPGFERDIKPLFRELDRESMESAFDLWSLEDVKLNAEDILRVVETGTMPCDAPWPKSQVETFKRWVEAGSPP